MNTYSFKKERNRLNFSKKTIHYFIFSINFLKNKKKKNKQTHVKLWLADHLMSDRIAIVWSLGWSHHPRDIWGCRGHPQTSFGVA